MISVREYLIKKGFNFKETKRPSGMNAIMVCPYCHHRDRTFAINLEHGAFKCFRENKCGVSGSFWQFQEDMGDEPRKLYKDNFDHKKKKEYKKPKKEIKTPKSKIIEYLMSRKLNIETIKDFKIGQDKDEKTYMFPYYKNGELVNIKYRQIDSKKMWQEGNAEPVLFNRDQCNGSDYLIITEGEIDCMTWAQMGFKAVSVPSGVDDMRWIENEWDYIEKFHKIYINMDEDEAGKKALKKIVARLGAWRCFNVWLPKKDANECLMGGANKKYFQDALEAAEGFDIKELVTAGYYRDEVKKLYSDEGRLVGVPTGLNGLDNMIKGWRGGEVSVWTGMNGSGKSTFLNQIIIMLADRKIKSCLGSFEMPPERILRWVVMQKSEYTLIGEEEVDKVLNAIDDYLFMINIDGLIKTDQLFNIFEFGVRKYGINHFFIDSLMRIHFKNRDINTEQTEFISDLVSFAKKYDIHIHLVAHPRKPPKDNDRPGKVDISGTGNITNLAQNVFSFWRTSEDQKDRARSKGKDVPDNILYVKKNREYGIEGKVNLRFDRNRKWYREILE